jgi:hypothetical protein
MQLLCARFCDSVNHVEGQMSSRFRAAWLTLVVLACTGAPARADVVLDQQFIPGSSGTNLLSAFSGEFSGLRHAQTLTVGITGTLTEVDIYSLSGGLTMTALTFSRRSVVSQLRP